VKISAIENERNFADLLIAVCRGIAECREGKIRFR